MFLWLLSMSLMVQCQIIRWKIKTFEAYFAVPWMTHLLSLWLWHEDWLSCWSSAVPSHSKWQEMKWFSRWDLFMWADPGLLSSTNCKNTVALWMLFIICMTSSEISFVTKSKRCVRYMHSALNSTRRETFKTSGKKPGLHDLDKK